MEVNFFALSLISKVTKMVRFSRVFMLLIMSNSCKFATRTIKKTQPKTHVNSIRVDVRRTSVSGRKSVNSSLERLEKKRN